MDTHAEENRHEIMKDIMGRNAWADLRIWYRAKLRFVFEG